LRHRRRATRGGRQNDRLVVRLLRDALLADARPVATAPLLPATTSLGGEDP
jgi:hypothetical protein